MASDAGRCRGDLCPAAGVGWRRPGAVRPASCLQFAVLPGTLGSDRIRIGTVANAEKEKKLLKSIVKVGLIGCGSFVALMVLLVAGLLAWDYIDQKMAEREEKKAASGGGQPSATGATSA